MGISGKIFSTIHSFIPLKEVDTAVINGLAKAGYLLIGAGIGVFASSFILSYEFDKAVGEIEEFVPEGGYDISDDQTDGSESDGPDFQSENPNSTDIRKRGGTREHGRKSGADRSDGGEETHQEFQSNQAQILDYYKSSEKDIFDKKERGETAKRSRRRKEFDRMREEGNANLGTRYSKMFGSEHVSNDQEMVDILHAVSSKTDTKESYSQYETRGHRMTSQDDTPSDDMVDDYPPGEIDIHDEYTLERVEDHIEIYLDDNPNDFVTLVWYQGDETLCDDGEQIVPNPEDIIGEVAIDRLLEGGPGADDGVIFVHNLKTCVDYEVVLDMGCYAETVLGMFNERRSRLNDGGGKGGSS